MLARSGSSSESETGKRVTEYFETKEEAEDFIAEHRKTGSIHSLERYIAWLRQMRMLHEALRRVAL